MEFDDFLITRVSLVCSVIGTIILLFFSFNSAYKEVKIKEINNELIGEKVSVKGIISSKFFSEKTMFFNLKEGETSIKAVKFNPSIEDFELNEGSLVEVKGSVQEYKKELEIIAEEIKRAGYE